MRSVTILALGLLMHVSVGSQERSYEYRVKAVYLFNFVKFIEWPAKAESGPLTICVAEHNPFGDALIEAVRGELVNDRPVTTRVIKAPDPACHVVFVPQSAKAKPYLDAARATPTLTVGEAPGFIREGGIVSFILDQGKVRFEIDPMAAENARLRISSHLLRLARIADEKGQP